MTRRSLGILVIGLATAGSAAAATDTNTVTFNITGASAIDVAGDIIFDISATATPGGITFTSNSPQSTGLAYTSVSNNGGNNIIFAIDGGDPMPSGLTFTITSDSDANLECGTGQALQPGSGGTIVSGINGGINCATTLTYDLTIDEQNVNPGQSGSIVSYLFTLSEN